MMLGGSCEQGMAQWASAFAESALLDSNSIDPALAKTIGDLMGPCLFAIMMGISRITYAKLCQKYDLRKMMILSGLLCIICYLVAALSQNPYLSLIGCGVCGFSVGIMWPGTLDLAGMSCPFGGTALFAMLALAGDMGCMLGPSVIGVAADALGGGQLRTGMLIAALIPAALVIILIIFGMKQKRRAKK
jgi:MFS family permease